MLPEKKKLTMLPLVSTVDLSRLSTLFLCGVVSLDVPVTRCSWLAERLFVSATRFDAIMLPVRALFFISATSVVLPVKAQQSASI